MTEKIQLVVRGEVIRELDPDDIDFEWCDGERASFKNDAPDKALAAAVKAAKRDPWEEWKKSIGAPWKISFGDIHDNAGRYILGGKRGFDDALVAAAAAPDMAEALRNLYRAAFTAPSVTNAVMEEAANALRKAGVPGPEPEISEDVPSAEERNRRQRAGLCRLCGGDKGGCRWWCEDCTGKDADLKDGGLFCSDRYEIDRELAAEDVPELWVSRDMDGGGCDLWARKPALDRGGLWWRQDHEDTRVALRFRCRIRDALALKPGDCRRVTRDEYRRYFEPVLALDPSERYAALEGMVL